MRNIRFTVLLNEDEEEQLESLAVALGTSKGKAFRLILNAASMHQKKIADATALKSKADSTIASSFESAAEVALNATRPAGFAAKMAAIGTKL